MKCEGKLKLKLRKVAEEKVTAGRNLVEAILKDNRVVYGITTGFGKFARTVITPEKLELLQENLIRSHSAGVGQPLTLERVRMLLALRINILAKGYSGISLKVLQQIIAAFNCSCLPWVPEQGTVGASGDLAPLSHLALGMMGEGKMWSPKTGWTDAKYCLESNGLEPIKLGAKEGLALINGTQLITALGAEAVARSELIAKQADVVAALSLEVLKGTSRAFDSDIHNLRPHPGQINVAQRLRSLCHSEAYPSAIAESHRFCDRVQDAYTLRCCPQVHGIVHDTIEFVEKIITTEMNSATDNPIVLPERGEIISAGNFHGEYPAKALDYLAIGVHELAVTTSHIYFPSIKKDMLFSSLCFNLGDERAAHRTFGQPSTEWIAGLPGQRRRTQFRFHDRPLHGSGLGLWEQMSVSSVQRWLAEHQRWNWRPRLNGRIFGPQGPADCG